MKQIRVFGGMIQNSGRLDMGHMDGVKASIKGLAAGSVHEPLQQRMVDKEIPGGFCVICPENTGKVFPEGLPPDTFRCPG